MHTLRNFSAVLALCLLLVQSVVMIHGASHGLMTDNEDCDVCLLAELQNSVLITALVITAACVLTFQFSFPRSHHLRLERTYASQARAPPVS